MQETTDLKVFISNRGSTCNEYGENLGRKAWITPDKGKGALCLACADGLDNVLVGLLRMAGACGPQEWKENQD
jgi:hypothetical protein